MCALTSTKKVAATTAVTAVSATSTAGTGSQQLVRALAIVTALLVALLAVC
jgi:hypothetical protein